MELNAEDKGNRKFIMVQMPEECKDETEAQKMGYKTICDIGEERIRRAGKKIKDELIEKKNNAGTNCRYRVDILTNIKIRRTAYPKIAITKLV